MNTIDRSKLRAKYGDEMVLVVHADELPAMVNGFVAKSEFVLPILAEKSLFLLRSEAEFNPRFRQLIPYVVIRCFEGKTPMYFALQRLSGSGEERLVSKTTIGIGGHINPCDAKDPNGYMLLANKELVIHNAMWRELNEEILNIDVVGINNMKFIGLINDTSDEVGRDHLGLVYMIDISTDQISAKETDKHTGEWMVYPQLVRNYASLENWSKIILQELNEGR